MCRLFSIRPHVLLAKVELKYMYEITYYRPTFKPAPGSLGMIYIRTDRGDLTRCHGMLVKHSKAVTLFEYYLNVSLGNLQITTQLVVHCSVVFRLTNTT